MPFELHHWEANAWKKAISSDLSFSMQQRTNRQDTIMIYVSYTKGDETLLKVTTSFQEKDIPGLFFDDGFLDFDSVVKSKVFMLTNSGKFRVPISVSPNEELLKVTFEFVGSSGVSPGEVVSWARPAAMSM